MVHGGLTLMGYETVLNGAVAACASIAFAVIGEVMFNGWMTAIEIAESIQEKKNETI